MKSYSKILIATAIALGLISLGSIISKSFEDDGLGLSKVSVFSTPDPLVAKSSAGEPGENQTQPAYFDGAPPLIPHQVQDYLPITLADNYCLECHDLAGEEVAEGGATPIPASHYNDLRAGAKKPSENVVGERYLCTQCHVPPMDVQPLVPNTYRQ